MNLRIFAVFALLLTLCAAAPSEAAYGVGDTPADFTLNDAYGTPISLYDYDGMVIFLVFWTDT